MLSVLPGGRRGKQAQVRFMNQTIHRKGVVVALRQHEPGGDHTQPAVNQGPSAVIGRGIAVARLSEEKGQVTVIRLGRHSAGSISVQLDGGGFRCGEGVYDTAGPWRIASTVLVNQWYPRANLDYSNGAIHSRRKPAFIRN